MILADEIYNECINSPVRRVKGRVELYEGSTLLRTFNSTDNLKSFTVERAGEETKFFGYGVCQKLTVKLIDKAQDIVIEPSNTLEVVLGTKCYYTYTYPVFYITGMSRDEITNEIKLEAYDALHKASGIKVRDLGLAVPYTLETFAAAAAAALGIALNTEKLPDGFDLIYPNGANFEGTETLREALDALAEVTQTIYYIDNNWELTFKRLDLNSEPVLTIDKSKYFSLKSGSPCLLSKVAHATELGDNLIDGAEGGVTQYIRNNPFWEMRDDVASLVSLAATNVAGLRIQQFDCSWRGNYLLEIGDKIAITAKDDSTIITYLLNDSVSYNGALSEKTQWTYSESEGETSSNPATLGETLKMTYAKVDKVNHRVEIVASEANNNSENISQLIMDTQNISASVSSVEQSLTNSINGVNNEIATLTKSVEAKMTAEDVSIAIKSELDNGVDKVTTTTGFTFNDEGLTVSKSGSEMTTQITEDGMSVYRDGNEVLTADHVGVKAENLHAITYLIIGKNSRLEDYNNNRTGCFWIGG